MNFTVQNKEKISKKVGTLFFFSLFVCMLFLSSPGFGQTTRICDQPPGTRTRLIQSFGHRSTSLTGPISSKDAFVAMFSQDRFLADFREVLRQACLENYESEMLSAIRGGVSETTITSGTEIKWVAGRRGGRVKVVGPARYVGTKPAEAYQWEARLGDTIYTFAAPKVCGNILLLDTRPAPMEAPPPAPPPPAPPPPAPAPSCVLTMTTVETDRRCTTVEVRSDVAGTLEIQFNGVALTDDDLLERAGQPDADWPLPAKLDANEAVTVRLCEEGNYTARLTAENGAVCDASTDIIYERAKSGPFVSAFFGKERRDNEEFFAGCDPIVGFQGGYGFFVGEHFEIAPAFGVKINTEDGDRSSVFADLEFNYHWERAMVGAGIGIWDITEGDSDEEGNFDTRDGALLLQFGIHLTRGTGITWLNQSRLFFDNADDVENNYMIWTGLRFTFH